MEIPRKHDNKNNPTKTLPLAIKIGAGAGAGAGKFGIVLFGGVLVTATIVSALAFKRISQRRSTSENMNKNMSPAPEIQSVDDPNKLEVENLSSDEVAIMKEIEAENIQSLTMDESYNYEEARDSKEDMTIVSVVDEDQENTWIHVESAFESEEQVVMEGQIEDDSCLKINDGSEEHKHLMLIDGEHVDTNSLVSEVSKNEDEDHQETELLDETAAAILECGCVNQVKEIEMNGHGETGYADQIGHEVVLEKEATDAARLLETEVTEEKEVIKTDCVNLVNTEDVCKTTDYEVAPDAQKMHQDCGTYVVAYVMNILKETVDVDDQTATKEDAPLKNKEIAQKVKEQVNPPTQLMIIEHELIKKDEIPQVQSVKEDADSEEYAFKMVADHDVAPETHQVCETLVAESITNRLNEAAHDQTTEKMINAGEKHKETEQKFEEQASMEDNLFNGDEKCDVDQMTREQLVEEAKVDDETESELVKKDEIQHVESVTEDEDSEDDVTVKEVIKMDDHEDALEMHQLCETFVAVEDQTTAKEDAPPSPLTSKEDKNKEAAQKVEEHATIEDEKCNIVKEMIHELLTDAAKVDDQTENDFVSKDEVKDVESVKEDENSEELKPKANISDHKIEENMEENENRTNLSKNENDSDNNGIIKEDKDGKQAFAAGETWDFKMMIWSVLISVWCIFHWYSDLPFPELSLVGSLLFVLILLGYRNRTTYLLKYESK